MDIKDALSPRQFAKEAGCSKQAVIDAIKAKKIHAERFDTVWVIPKNQVSVFKKLKRNYPTKTKKRS